MHMQTHTKIKDVSGVNIIRPDYIFKLTNMHASVTLKSRLSSCVFEALKFKKKTPVNVNKLRDGYNYHVSYADARGNLKIGEARAFFFFDSRNF